MPQITRTHRPAELRPAGTRLVRLADIPLETRLQALDQVISTAKTETEATRLVMLAIDPGDASGRITAA